MSKVYAFKLTSGEEIISRLDSSDDGGDENSFILSNPRVLIMNNKGLGLAPLMFSANPDETITLNKSAIACYTDTVSEELATGYNNSISKIIVPDKSILLG